MELKLIGTLVVIALSAVLTLIGKRLDQKDAKIDNVLLAAALLVALWLPQGFRDFVLIAFAVMMGGLGGRGLAIAAGALTFGLAVWVPGGTIVVLLGLCAILAYVSARQERGRLVSLMKAALLEPGEDKQIEVAVIGPATARGVRHPGTGEPVAAWWARVVDARGERAHTASSETPVTIETESGNALADLSTVEVSLTEVPSTTVSGDDARALAASFGCTDIGDLTVTISHIKPGASVFVKGVPVWEASREGGGYRDSPYVPVFRASESNPLSFKPGTLDQLKRNIMYSIVMWGAWAIPCAGIAAIQIAIDVM